MLLKINLRLFHNIPLYLILQLCFILVYPGPDTTTADGERDNKLKKMELGVGRYQPRKRKPFTQGKKINMIRQPTTQKKNKQQTRTWLFPTGGGDANNRGRKRGAQGDHQQSRVGGVADHVVDHRRRPAHPPLCWLHRHFATLLDARPDPGSKKSTGVQPCHGAGAFGRL